MDGIQRLHDIMTRLRDPEKGCPWDRAQTLETLKPCVLEETYELLAAMDRPEDIANHVEELGISENIIIKIKIGVHFLFYVDILSIKLVILSNFCILQLFVGHLLLSPQITKTVGTIPKPPPFSSNNCLILLNNFLIFI